MNKKLQFILYCSKIERINVQKMNKLKHEQDHFEVLRKIQKKPKASQRELAEDLGFSLGKLNYCLKTLKKKGLIKLRNFQKQKNKISYLQIHRNTQRNIFQN